MGLCITITYTIIWKLVDVLNKCYKALKDNGVRLVGETTFGKGIIQGTSKFKDGSALKLTIMQYFSPEGNAIHEKGVIPDYKVKDKESTDKDEQLEKAELLLN